MVSLKNKILILISISFLGCATTQNTDSSFFVIKYESEGATEVIVTPDRVLLQCEELDEDPDEGRYGFMIHILDEENTVTTTSLNVRPDKRGCEKIYKDVAHIMKKAKRLYIANHIKLSDQPRVEDRKFPHTFPGHGTFYDNSRSLDFDIIVNDKGQCYNVHVKKDEPCMEYPFPIEKYEKRLRGNK